MHTELHFLFKYYFVPHLTLLLFSVASGALTGSSEADLTNTNPQEAVLPCGVRSSCLTRASGAERPNRTNSMLRTQQGRSTQSSPSRTLDTPRTNT